jgi:hypothetical protein
VSLGRKSGYTSALTLLLPSLSVPVLVTLIGGTPTQKVHHPDEALPDEADDDLVVMATQDENSLICSITRKLLEKPVKKYYPLPPPECRPFTF